MRAFRPWLLLGCGGFLFAAGATASGAAELSAVASKVSNGYERAREPDGGLRRETYAFGRGGRYDSTTANDSIDTMPFDQLTRSLAPALAARNYLPAHDPAKTDLMIVVYWGSTLATRGGDGKPVINKEYVENFNARMMGFSDAVNRARDLYFTTYAHDVLDEFEPARYFVVLRAYDFPLAYREKKLKLLWETRISIRKQGNDFVETLPLMARDASRFFGEDSKGLNLRPVGDGKVRLGDMKFLTTEPTAPAVK